MTSQGPSFLRAGILLPLSLGIVVSAAGCDKAKDSADNDEPSKPAAESKSEEAGKTAAAGKPASGDLAHPLAPVDITVSDGAKAKAKAKAKEIVGRAKDGLLAL